MNTSDLLNEIQSRLEHAAVYAYGKSDELDSYERGFADGLMEAIKILDGVEYEWGEMQSGREREHEQQVEKNLHDFLIYK